MHTNCAGHQSHFSLSTTYRVRFQPNPQRRAEAFAPLFCHHFFVAGIRKPFGAIHVLTVQTLINLKLVVELIEWNYKEYIKLNYYRKTYHLHS